MKYGLVLPQDGLEYKKIRDTILEAERIGFYSFWVFDHLHASPRPDKEQILECLTLLSALAAETKKIRLGILVLNINNRYPALVAKMVSTLDQISCGRVDFGVGAGGTNRAEIQKNLGYEYEFDAYGVSFPIRPSIRIEKLDEGLKIMKKMWTQEAASFKGKHYSINNAICLPKPVQKPHPPIWIGGLGKPKLIKVIAEHADGWNMMRALTIQDLKNGLKNLRKACEKIGRNPEELKISVIVNGASNDFREKLKEFEEEKLDLALLRFPKNREIEYLQKFFR